MQENYLKPGMETFKSCKRVKAAQLHFPVEVVFFSVDDHGKSHQHEIKPGQWLVRDEDGRYLVLNHTEFKNLYEPLENAPLLYQRTQPCSCNGFSFQQSSRCKVEVLGQLEETL